jgi:hypothetical protein
MLGALATTRDIGVPLNQRHLLGACQPDMLEVAAPARDL